LAAWSAATRHARGRAVAVREGWWIAAIVAVSASPASDRPTLHGCAIHRTPKLTRPAPGARVDIRADNVLDGISADDHAAGLTSTLAKLAEYLEQ
jgi:hypothetical protein